MRWTLLLVSVALGALACRTAAESGPLPSPSAGEPDPQRSAEISPAAAPRNSSGDTTGRLRSSSSRLFSPALRREGLPLPGGPIPACHEQRRSHSAPFELLPAAVDSVFLSCQVVAYYGFPGLPGMGVLGTGPPDEIARLVRSMVADYDAVNGPRVAVGAFHLVVAVAQASPTADGTWLVRMPESMLEAWLEAARQHGLLVILDVQVGHSTAAAEIQRLLPYLSNSRVHLAIDPEWAMAPGEVPGTVIGGLDAADINRAQESISAYIRERGLPRRTLIVHQFVPGMIRHKETLQAYDGVDLLIDTDGFGSRAQKVANYNRYIAAEGAPHGGFKLFFHQDYGLMTPGDVASLVPQPDLVIYQ